MENNIKTEIQKNLESWLNLVEDEENFLKFTDEVWKYYLHYKEIWEEYNALEKEFTNLYKELIASQEIVIEEKIAILNLVIFNFDQKKLLYEKMLNLFQTKFKFPEETDHVGIIQYNAMEKWIKNQIEKITDNINNFKEKINSWHGDLQYEKDLQDIDKIYQEFVESGYLDHRVHKRFLIDDGKKQIVKGQIVDMNWLNIIINRYDVRDLKTQFVVETIDWTNGKIVVTATLKVRKATKIFTMQVSGFYNRDTQDELFLIDWISDLKLDENSKYENKRYDDFFGLEEGRFFSDTNLGLNPLDKKPPYSEIKYCIKDLNYETGATDIDLHVIQHGLEISKAFTKTLHFSNPGDQIKQLKNALKKFSDEKSAFDLKNNVGANETWVSVIKIVSNYLKNNENLAGKLIGGLTWKIVDSTFGINNYIYLITGLNKYSVTFEVKFKNLLIGNFTMHFINIKWSEEIKYFNEDSLIFPTFETGPTDSQKQLEKTITIDEKFDKLKISNIVELFSKYSKIKLCGLTIYNDGQKSTIRIINVDREFDFKIDLIDQWITIENQDFDYTFWRQGVILTFKYFVTNDFKLKITFRIETYSRSAGDEMQTSVNLPWIIISQ